MDKKKAIYVKPSLKADRLPPVFWNGFRTGIATAVTIFILVSLASKLVEALLVR